MSEAKPTPGEWLLELEQNGGWCIFVGPTFDMDVHRTIASRGQWPHNIAESHANAALLHDAGNTYNTTGLTPSQLVEQRDQLVERVKELEEIAEDFMDAQADLDNREYMGIHAEPYEVLVRRRNLARDDLDTALSKARPNTAEGEVWVNTQGSTR